MGKTREKRKNAASPLLERITLVYTAVLCSVGLLLPGLRGYTAAGRSAFFFCAGLPDSGDCHTGDGHFMVRG